MKKKVSFVNVNFQQGPKEFNAHYLPYSAGILLGYAVQFPEISDNYFLGEMIWKRDNINMEFQRNYLINHSELGTYPRTVELDYDFLGYLQGKGELEQAATYKYDFPDDKKMSIATFCE